MSDFVGNCPTGCGRKVREGHLMCGGCWSEVPTGIKREVQRTWKVYRGANVRSEHFPRISQEYRAARNAALAAIA